MGINREYKDSVFTLLFNDKERLLELYNAMNLPALKGGVSCKRCIIYEVRSVRKLFNCGVYYHFS
jgi:hypothetical protein